MYQAFLYIAFLAFCSSAPYGDSNSARSTFVQQQQPAFIQQQQPQQQLTNVIRGQQQDQTDVVDTLGAGYSYFKKQPIVSRPLAQQQFASNEQQVPITSFTDTSNQWAGYQESSALKQQQPQQRTLIGQDQGAYGSALNQVQQPVSRNLGSSYGQQQQDTQVLVQQPSVIRNLGNSYGQQQPTVQTFVPQQQVVRSLVGSYGQQQPQQQLDQSSLNTQGNTGYGQQQQDVQILLPQQQTVQTFVPQQQVVRSLVGSYGQQQQQPQQQLDQSSWNTQGNTGYGQQVQQLSNDLVGQGGYGQQTQQRIAPKVVLSGSYGQQTQQLSNDLVGQGGYGQQVQQRVVVPTVSSGYGQQTQQPLNDLVSQGGYGQQVQQRVFPTLSSGFVQQQQQQQPQHLTQQALFSGSSSSLAPSQRLVQSQPSQTSDSGSW